MADLEDLINEFRTEFESGGDPDPREFLARVDQTQRKDFARRLDAYLDTAPTQAWDPDVYESSLAKLAVERVFESIEGEAGTWPELLPTLRKRAQIARDELTRRLAEGLGFESKRDAKRVHDYYHDMEHGLIPARGVSDRVLDVLAGLVGTSREALRAAGKRGGDVEVGTQTSFARMAMLDEDYADANYAAESLADTPAASSPDPASRDELDELFLGHQD